MNTWDIYMNTVEAVSKLTVKADDILELDDDFVAVNYDGDDYECIVAYIPKSNFLCAAQKDKTEDYNLIYINNEI